MAVKKTLKKTKDGTVDKRTKEGKEVLLPVIKECILDVNVNDGIVRVHIMPGLI